MFPINGKPFGPGGYGSLDLLREPRDLRYLPSAIMETVTPIETVKWEIVFVSSNMVIGIQKRWWDRLTPLQSYSSEAFGGN